MSTSSSLARFFAKPWVDPLCLWGMGWLLPAARCWAAAHSGNPDDFVAELGLHSLTHRLAARVRQTGALGRQSAAAQAAWNDTVFGGTGDVAAAERARRLAAHNYLGHRFSYLWFAKRAGIPAVKLDVPLPATIDAVTGNGGPDAFFALPPTMPSVTRSRVVEQDGVREYWLCFPSPGNPTDTCWVHVYEGESRDGTPVPSLIFGHGFAMEMEMMRGDMRGYRGLAATGCRILLPDAPGHNRRTTPGLYGGESFIMRPPLSGLQHFRQTAHELAAIIAWCRGEGSRRVGLGGTSLGALTAQVVASRMGTWPEDARPDTLMLLTTTDKVSRLTFNSSLADITGLSKAAALAGWSDREIDHLAAFTDAAAAPPVDPASIVLLIGKRDDVTPYDGGQRLADNWRIPPENLFVRDQGHFSAAIGLESEPAPYLRTLALLKGQFGG